MGGQSKLGWAGPHQAVYFGSSGNSKYYTLFPHSTHSLKAKARNDCAAWLLAAGSLWTVVRKFWLFFDSHLHVYHKNILFPATCGEGSADSSDSCTVLPPVPKIWGSETHFSMVRASYWPEFNHGHLLFETAPSSRLCTWTTCILTKTFQVQIWMSAF